MTSKKVTIWIFFSIISFFLVSCEDFYKKEIDIESSDAGRKLVVEASLEDDLFYVFVSLSQPITSVPVSVSERVEEAVVRLYEDGQLLLEITEPDQTPDQDYYIPGYQDYYPYAVRQRMKVKPGKSYRLEVSSPGYPPVTSTVIAPQQLEITDVSVNTSQVIERDPDGFAYPDVWQGGVEYTCPSFYQMNMRIKDNPDKKDYYLIEAFETSGADTVASGMYAMGNRLTVATTDRVLIQDNPDVVANQWISDPEVNTFVFSQMILTDLTFQGQNNNLSLLLSSCNLHNKDNSCEELIKYGFPEYRLNRVTYYWIALVKHICTESFDYYRTFALQRMGLDYFSEPVNIISNMDGGYGCFSVATTSKITLMQYDICQVAY